MSRYVEVHRICDPSSLHHDEVPATTERTLVVGKGKPVLLDLCDSCAAIFDGLLANAVPMDKANSTTPKPRKVPVLDEQEPRRKRGQPPIPGPHICTLCDHPEFEKRSQLGSHVRQAHKMSIKDLPTSQT